MHFYSSFMLYCKLQRYNHTNSYVFKCVSQTRKGVCIYTDICILPFRQKLIWFHKNRHQVLAAWRVKYNNLVKPLSLDITKGVTFKLLLSDYRIKSSFCSPVTQNESPFPIQVIATGIRNSFLDSRSLKTLSEWRGEFILLENECRRGEETSFLKSTSKSAPNASCRGLGGDCFSGFWGPSCDELTPTRGGGCLQLRLQPYICPTCSAWIKKKESKRIKSSVDF